jgi:hypothetical protein
MEKPLYFLANENLVNTPLTQQLTETSASMKTVLPLVASKNPSANKIIAVKQPSVSVKRILGHPVFNSPALRSTIASCSAIAQTTLDQAAHYHILGL